MRALSLSISILVAILSIIVFREQVTEFATTSFNSVLANFNKFYNGDSSTVTTTTAAKPESESPFYNPKEKLVANDMSVPRAIRKVFLAAGKLKHHQTICMIQTYMSCRAGRRRRR